MPSVIRSDSLSPTLQRKWTSTQLWPVKVGSNTSNVNRVVRHPRFVSCMRDCHCLPTMCILKKRFIYPEKLYFIGGEWNYVIFSTVRSLPRYRIEKRPTLGWCKKSLGFISDAHQINVALTRARRGLIIIGWFF